MNWRDRDLDTIGDLNDVMYLIYKDGDQEEARLFLAAYRAENEHADANIGYLTGYYGPTEAEALREFFDVSHPIFGRKSPTPEEAFTAGQRLAYRSMEGIDD